MSNLSMSNSWNKFWGGILGANQRYSNALLESIETRDLTGVRDALYNGADANHVNNFGMTPLHIAAWAQPQAGIIEMLIECGANINAANENGDTPLHLSAQYNNLELSILLLSYKANVNPLNYQGQYPGDYAKIYGADDVAALLLKYGALSHQQPVIIETVGEVQGHELSELDALIATSFIDEPLDTPVNLPNVNSANFEEHTAAVYAAFESDTPLDISGDLFSTNNYTAIVDPAA